MISIKNLRSVHKPKGFTIIELLVATVVFSVVLLVALTGFLEMSRIFYSGVTITRTQDTTKQIVDDISSQIKVASSISNGLQTSPKGYKYYCVGTTRYTLNIGNEVDLSTEFGSSQNFKANGNYGLLRDRPVGGCSDPCDVGCSAPFSANKTEMLGNKMRLEALSIAPPTGATSLYSVSIILAYGDDDALSGSPPGVTCIGSAYSDQYCDVYSLVTSVHRGLGI